MAKAARAAQAWRVYKQVSQPGSPGLITRLRTVPRMVGAVTRGRYPGMSKSRLAMLGLGVVYILSPIDVIPDFLALVGVADDFGVLLWLTASLLGESGRYLDWERGNIQASVFPPEYGRQGSEHRR
ncbi:YkvA family protein [Streptosporangium sp. NPDC001559]|uniref:YkvA family protein n=1 Tax=Streptosporangium sp. NPDC001559 TaxID=3366187 RepID=UPI0036EBF6A1